MSLKDRRERYEEKKKGDRGRGFSFEEERGRRGEEGRLDWKWKRGRGGEKGRMEEGLRRRGEEEKREDCGGSLEVWEVQSRWAWE